MRPIKKGDTVRYIYSGWTAQYTVLKVNKRTARVRREDGSEGLFLLAHIERVPKGC